MHRKYLFFPVVCLLCVFVAGMYTLFVARCSDQLNNKKRCALLL